jgi:hypothetical protein
MPHATSNQHNNNSTVGRFEFWIMTAIESSNKLSNHPPGPSLRNPYTRPCGRLTLPSLQRRLTRQPTHVLQWRNIRAGSNCGISPSCVWTHNYSLLKFREVQSMR